MTELTRRDLIRAGVALAATLSAPAARADGVMPVGFVSHGSPLLATDRERGALLAAWGRALPKPVGIVVMTPHYGVRHLEIGATHRGFGMYNMPAWLRRQLPRDLAYPSPPSEELAAQVVARLGGESAVARGSRPGFDHTTWIPLLHLRPAADVPVLELAYPYLRERALFALGRRLAPLRNEGVLFLGSGGLTHNLASLGSDDAAVPAWSREFDAWAAERVAAHDVDAVLDWRQRAPAADLAHPDDGGHFRVLVVALGVAMGGQGRVSFPETGFEATLSTRCIELA